MFIPKIMHDAALHIIQHPERYDLSEAERYDIRQVAEGHVGVSDEAAASRGIDAMRRVYRALGKACPF